MFILCIRADTATDAGGELVFMEQRLLLRSYKSVSLSDGGTYRLTLADCHGFALTSSSSHDQSTLPLPTHMGGHPDRTGDGAGCRDPAQNIRLFFLPLPQSIEFSVERGEV